MAQTCFIHSRLLLLEAHAFCFSLRYYWAFTLFACSSSFVSLLPFPPLFTLLLLQVPLRLRLRLRLPLGLRLLFLVLACACASACAFAATYFVHYFFWEYVDFCDVVRSTLLRHCSGDALRATWGVFEVHLRLRAWDFRLEEAMIYMRKHMKI